MLDVPPAGAAHVAVRAGSDAPPVAAGPVEQVVAAAGLLARGPVGDLVPAEPVSAERGVGGEVAVGHRVVVGRGQLTAAYARGQAGAVLDDERVRGDVVGPGGDGGVEAGLPVGVALAGRAVDQVEVDVVEAGLPRPGDALLRPAGRVRAVEHGQDVLAGALHPERHAGEARLTERGEGG